MYCDVSIRKAGLNGEKVQSGAVIAVKTHYHRTVHWTEPDRPVPLGTTVCICLFVITECLITVVLFVCWLSLDYMCIHHWVGNLLVITRHVPLGGLLYVCLFAYCHNIGQAVLCSTGHKCTYIHVHVCCQACMYLMIVPWYIYNHEVHASHVHIM